MKKSIRTLLIMLAVLVVLGGGAAVLLLTQPSAEEDSSSSSTSTETETVVDRDENTITSVAVENTLDSFTMIPQEEGTTSQEESSSSEEDSSSESKSVQFTIDGYQGFDLNISQVTAAAKSVASISASKNLGEQEDLAQFGLTGDSAVNIQVKYEDGTTDTLVVGNEAGESTGRYLLIDGTVYISSSLSGALLESPLYFFSTDLYSVADRVEETVDSEGSSSTTTLSDILYRIEFTGSHLEEDQQPIVIQYDGSKISGYLITSPVTAESGSNTFTEIVTALKSLSAESVVAAGRTQETLEQYGLSEPYAQITFDMNGEEHTLAVSAVNEEGNRYLLCDDLDAVYEVANDSVSSWAEASLMDLRMSYVWLPNIKNVSALTLDVNGSTQYRFDVEQVLNEEKSTEDDPSYDLEVTNGDGQTVDYDNYQPFYQLVLSQAVLSTATTEYDESQVVLEITYEYFDGSDPDVVTFCVVPGQSERYAALLNGEYNGLVRRSEIDSLIEKAAVVYENQSIE